MADVLMLDMVKIGGIKYDVEFPFQIETNEELLGMHYLPLSKIRVVDTFNGDKLTWCRIHELFIHEIFHAIDHSYCNTINEERIKHPSITKLSFGWHQVLTDNNLNIKDFKTYPKYVKVGGFKYEIVSKHQFKDEINEVWYDVKNIKNKLYFTDKTYEGKLSNDFKSLCLCTAILYAVCSVYMGEEEDEALIYNMSSLGSGIHQVLKDNDIENIIKNGIRYDKKRSVKQHV